MRRKTCSRIAELLTVAKSLMVAVVAAVIFPLAASATETQGYFEQRYHEAAAAQHNNDAVKALGIWLELARQGHADSQFAVGSLYGEGLGGKLNIQETVHWWRQAAGQGHSGAQFNLGALYSEGLGVPQNAAEAVRLWQRAAEACNKDAMYQLGLSYQAGRGVPTDLRLAHTWFKTAVLKGIVAFSNDAEQVATALGPEELAASIADAKAQAARCDVYHQTPPPTR